MVMLGKLVVTVHSLQVVAVVLVVVVTHQCQVAQAAVVVAL